MKKRIISALTAAAVAISGAFALTASAGGGIPFDWQIYYLENGKYPDRTPSPTLNGFTYTENADGTVKITDFTINSTEITIPSTLGGKKVTSMSFGWTETDKRNKIQKINIPADVEIIAANSMTGSEWYKNLPRTNGLIIVNGCVIGSDLDYASMADYLSDPEKTNFFNFPNDFNSVIIKDSSGKRLDYGSTSFFKDFKRNAKSVALNVGETYTLAFEKTYDKYDNGSNYVAESDAVPFTPTKAYGSYTVSLSGSGVIDKSSGHINGKPVITEDATMPYNLDLTSGIKVISNYAFDSKMINKLNISGSVTKIGTCAFRGASIKELNIGSSVKEIADSAFGSTKNLEKVTIASNVKISSYAFENSNWVEDQLKTKKFVVMNGTLLGSKPSATGENAMPDSITEPFGGYYLTPSTYNYETNVTTYSYIDNLTLPKGITEYPKNGMVGLCARNIEIPGTAVTLDDYSFGGMRGVKTIKLNEGTKTIGEYAFTLYADENNAVKLSSVTIPSSVKTIGKKAFGYAIMDNGSALKKIPDFEIKGAIGSAAETYAKANGFKFVAVSSGSVKYGDINKDGNVTDADVGLLQQYLADWKITIDETAADANGDGSVNEADIALLQQYLADWKVTLGPKTA